METIIEYQITRLSDGEVRSQIIRLMVALNGCGFETRIGSRIWSAKSMILHATTPLLHSIRTKRAQRAPGNR